MKQQLNCIEAPASGGFALRPPTGLCPLQRSKIFTCATCRPRRRAPPVRRQ